MAKKEEKEITWQEYLVESAKKKNKTLQVWFDGTVQHISQCQMATHVGKFTNPDVRESILVAYAPDATGYVYTQNTICRADILVPAQYMGSASLLLTEVNENQDIMEAVFENPVDIQEQLDQMSLPGKALCQAVLELRERSKQTPVKTDTRLKQVYFPINETDYHLLSVLPASSLMIELRKRIRCINEQKRDCYDKNHPSYGRDCKEINRLTVIGFGGTKPQNISALNSRQGGKAYLLESMPPTLVKRDLVYPKKDYFREVVWYRRKAETFYALDHYLKLDRNNLEIRRKIADITEDLVDYVMEGVYALRSAPAHWSEEEKYAALNPTQRIWLDEGYREERKETEWASHIGAQFARWVIESYERLMKEEKITLGDAELQYFQNRMEQLLKEEVRYGI